MRYSIPDTPSEQPVSVCLYQLLDGGYDNVKNKRVVTADGCDIQRLLILYDVRITLRENMITI